MMTGLTRNFDIVFNKVMNIVKYMAIGIWQAVIYNIVMNIVNLLHYTNNIVLYDNYD